MEASRSLRDGRAPHLLPPLYPPALPTAVADGDAGNLAAPTPSDAGRHLNLNPHTPCRPWLGTGLKIGLKGPRRPVGTGQLRRGQSAANFASFGPLAPEPGQGAAHMPPSPKRVCS